ncbi:hypothetical protein MNBD_GAMMA09-3866 [hydrothermal vent metagenome]|uniref:HTH cro/C1-type domain-containing protein n=1 Tax=hydrothermal vent metagenome TaxID=652676 RepID=A0A3B0X0A9_9ZZZZ
MNSPINNASDLGKLIHFARKQAGLTQHTAAGLCNVSVPFFNAIENGKATAQIDKVLHVCRQLGIRLEAITAEPNQPEQPL